jgi:2-iminobutanoate/2-iminopropanoate deaminase
MKIITDTPNLKAVGPYSLAVEKNGTLYASGQIGIDKDKNPVPGGIEGEFNQITRNITEILDNAGYEITDIAKVTILLKDINDFAKVNELYQEFFKEPYPARSTFQVAALPLGVSIEIEIIAAK